MLFWPGLFLLFPISACANPEYGSGGCKCVAAAQCAEAPSRTFPGLVAELRIELNGQVSRGLLIVERDGRVFVEQLPLVHRAWAGEHIDEVFRHRLPTEMKANRSLSGSWNTKMLAESKIAVAGKRVGACDLPTDVWILGAGTSALNIPEWARIVLTRCRLCSSSRTDLPVR
jgi:hypothetical protein